jgi:tight adherence protein B
MDGTTLIIAGTFVMVALVILAPYYLLVERPDAAAQAILRQRIKTGAGASVTQPTRARLLKDVERLSTIGPLNSFLSGDNAFATHLRGMIQLSGMKVVPGQVILGSGCLALLAYVLVLHWLPIYSVAMIAGAIAATLPYLVIRFRRNQRLRKFEEQFPEAVDLIARTLRAGHAFPTGLKMASEELPEPVSGEFRGLFEQQNYGLPMPDALKAFADRVPIIDARFFVTAVLTQREAGGNLAEVLDNLASVIRDRFKIKRQLRVLTAHGRMTGMVLAAMPPAIFLYLLMRMPEHFRVLIDDPLGVRMIIAAVILQVVGALLILKISNVEY